jgi:taurine dehydrogenase small subunit
LGRDGRVREAFARVFKAFPDTHFGNARHFVAGDRGVSEWIFTGTAVDGKKVEVNGCDLFTFKNGRFAVKSSYFKSGAA